MSRVFHGRFDGAVMLVTGGASGIGRATVERAAAEGAAVAILDRNAAAATALAEALAAAGHRVAAFSADVTREDDITRAVRQASERFGPLSVLVNNAGGAHADSFETTDPASWQADIALNLTGPWLVTRAAVPHLLATRGAIVNVATVNALTSIAQPGYSAAKAGLLQMTRQLASEYGPRGIRANAVVPGSIRTPIWDSRLQERPDVFDVLTKWYPVGRIGAPADIAGAILFLASDEAGFINGASLVVDGGLTSGLGQMTRDILDDAQPAS
jgi:NAD(P)-dependent dehydrogenase (short-subunit alcohol dehydrogenase family)